MTYVPACLRDLETINTCDLFGVCSAISNDVIKSPNGDLIW